MDLTVMLNETLLNIRTAILIETKKGYIFEKSPQNTYFFTVGGRIKTKETSLEAAKREVFEELGIEIVNLKMSAITENFFTDDNKNFHEICFYYKANYDKTFVLPPNFFALEMKDFHKHDIKPKIIIDIIKNKNNLIHIINKD